MRKQYHLWPGEERLDAWDVDRLIELSRCLPVEDVPLEEIKEIDSTYWFTEWQTPTVRSVVEHCELIRDIDPGYPIILGPDGRVMDGIAPHRPRSAGRPVDHRRRSVRGAARARLPQLRARRALLRPLVACLADLSVP